MLNRYKIIYKKDGMLFHEHIEAKDTDAVSRYVRETAGVNALLVYVKKEKL